MHPTGLPLTAKPLIDAGLLYDDEGQSIRAPNGLTRSVSIGDLISVGDSAGQSVSEEPSAGEAQTDSTAAAHAPLWRVHVVTPCLHTETGRSTPERQLLSAATPSWHTAF